MRYEYDPQKLAANVKKHAVWFEEAVEFEWETANLTIDDRNFYLETRFEAIGYIRERVYVMIFCLRVNAVRIISLRKANNREVKRYAET
jgi:uncharacterized DUF497 family protein